MTDKQTDRRTEFPLGVKIFPKHNVGQWFVCFVSNWGEIVSNYTSSTRKRVQNIWFDLKKSLERKRKGRCSMFPSPLLEEMISGQTNPSMSTVSGKAVLRVLNLNFWGLGWPWGSDKEVRWAHSQMIKEANRLTVTSAISIPCCLPTSFLKCHWKPGVSNCTNRYASGDNTYCLPLSNIQLSAQITKALTQSKCEFYPSKVVSFMQFLMRRNLEPMWRWTMHP